MKVVPLKMTPEMLSELDSLGGNRSEKIRTAVREWLVRNGGKPVPPPSQKPRTPVQIRTAAQAITAREYDDFRPIIEVLESRMMTERELAKYLGWPEGRVRRVVSKMEAAKLLSFARGGVKANEPLGSSRPCSGDGSEG